MESCPGPLRRHRRPLPAPCPRSSRRKRFEPACRCKQRAARAEGRTARCRRPRTSGCNSALHPSPRRSRRFRTTAPACRFRSSSKRCRRRRSKHRPGQRTCRRHTSRPPRSFPLWYTRSKLARTRENQCKPCLAGTTARGCRELRRSAQPPGTFRLARRKYPSRRRPAHRLSGFPCNPARPHRRARQRRLPTSRRRSLHRCPPRAFRVQRTGRRTRGVPEERAIGSLPRRGADSARCERTPVRVRSLMGGDVRLSTAIALRFPTERALHSRPRHPHGHRDRPDVSSRRPQRVNSGEPRSVETRGPADRPPALAPVGAHAFEACLRALRATKPLLAPEPPDI